jgi:hypothetical protein
VPVREANQIEWCRVQGLSLQKRRPRLSPIARRQVRHSARHLRSGQVVAQFRRLRVVQCHRVANPFPRPRVKQIVPAGRLLVVAPVPRALATDLAALAVLVPAVAQVVPAARVVRAVVPVAGQVRVADRADNAVHLVVRSDVVAAIKTSCSHSICN